MTAVLRPLAADVPSYFMTYVDQVPDGDVFATLRTLVDDTVAGASGFGDEGARHRYAEGKWSVKELLVHLSDMERLFAYRALSFARGDDAELPGVDEDAWAAAGGFDARPLASILEELRAVRAASLGLFEGFDAAAWNRGGTANGLRFPVTVFPWLIAGHEIHHLKVLRERYR